MNCYSFPLRCFKKVILRLCENSDLIYEIFTLGKRGVTVFAGTPLPRPPKFALKEEC